MTPSSRIGPIEAAGSGWDYRVWMTLAALFTGSVFRVAGGLLLQLQLFEQRGLLFLKLILLVARGEFRLAGGLLLGGLQECCFLFELVTLCGAQGAGFGYLTPLGNALLHLGVVS